MKKGTHKVFIGSMAFVIVLILVYIIYIGLSYYLTDLSERFYHPDYTSLKPSGAIGHGLGIVGTLAMVIGVSSYIMRKRMKILSKLGLLKHWLEFHIFLCTLGPILVLFHTSFKFGGVVAVSFWSMVAVFLSGVIGRYIYIQIPRSIEGRELTLQEVQSSKKDLTSILLKNYDLSEEVSSSILEAVENSETKDKKSLFSRIVGKVRMNAGSLRMIRQIARENNLDKKEYKEIVRLVKNEMTLNYRIERLQRMQKIFKYWHVAHLPFALVMLIIVVIHVIVTLTFGYKWIF
jgi:hypothetical protein